MFNLSNIAPEYPTFFVEGLNDVFYLGSIINIGSGLEDLKLSEEIVDGRLADRHQLRSVHRQEKVGLTVLANDLIDGHKPLSGFKENLQEKQLFN